MGVNPSQYKTNGAMNEKTKCCCVAVLLIFNARFLGSFRKSV